MSVSSSTQPTALQMFERMLEIRSSILQSDDAPVKPPREWIWAELPKHLEARLTEWRDMMIKAVPCCDAVDNLHVTLFHELLAFNDDLRMIIATVANTSPLRATLGDLKTFRIETGLAVVIEVVSADLENLRHKLEGVIEHTPSIHRFTPHVTLAYMPLDHAIEIDRLELHNIYGQEFVINSLNAGTKASHQKCEMFGSDPVWNARFAPTPSVQSDAEFGKSAGMSTMSGESGGFLMQAAMTEYSIDIDDEDEQEDDFEIEDDNDDDDEQWIRRSQEMADTLDDPFGDY
jgi:2'-5' RNA ligase